MRTKTNLLQEQKLASIHLKMDSEKLSELIKCHKESISRHIFSLVKDKNLTQDIFQDTCVRVINSTNNGKYVDRDKFLKWITEIAHNLCIDHFRKVKRTPKILTRCDDWDIFNILNSSIPGPDQIMMKKQSYANLRMMIEMLPEDKRNLIVMRYYDNLSFKEIAEATKSNSKFTASTRVRKEISNLRQMMEKKKIAL